MTFKPPTALERLQQREATRGGYCPPPKEPRARGMATCSPVVPPEWLKPLVPKSVHAELKPMRSVMCQTKGSDTDTYDVGDFAVVMPTLFHVPGTALVTAFALVTHHLAEWEHALAPDALHHLRLAQLALQEMEVHTRFTGKERYGS